LPWSMWAMMQKLRIRSGGVNVRSANVVTELFLAGRSSGATQARRGRVHPILPRPGPGDHEVTSRAIRCLTLAPQPGVVELREDTGCGNASADASNLGQQP
jgi:hypothetical protein